jgi:hypothetical protein
MGEEKVLEGHESGYLMGRDSYGRLIWCMDEIFMDVREEEVVGCCMCLRCGHG